MRGNLDNKKAIGIHSLASRMRTRQFSRVIVSLTRLTRRKWIKQNVCPHSNDDLFRLIINTILGPANGKAKEKDKAPSRQSTLFGLPLGPPADKKGRKKKTKDDSSQSQADEGGSGIHTPTAESTPGSSTQASDITMAEGSSEAATLVETQLNDEEYEAQNESQDMQDDMNGIVRILYVLWNQMPLLTLQKANEGEPIEWPPSPQTMPSEGAEVETTTL